MTSKFTEYRDKFIIFLARLRKEKRLWQIPILALIVFSILLLFMLLWSSGPDHETSSMGNQPIQNQEITAQPIDLPKIEETVTSPTKGFIASFALENKDAFQVVNRHQTYEEPKTWRLYMVQRGQLIIPALFANLPDRWSPLVMEEKKLSIHLAKKGSTMAGMVSFDRERKMKFALQLNSLPATDVVAALPFLRTLAEEGYYAYLYRTEQTLKKRGFKKTQFFYQLRIGFFAGESDAMTVADEVKERFNDAKLITDQQWPVYPKYQEISGDLLDFRILRNQPWMIHLPPTANESDVFAQLKSASIHAPASYVLQRLFRGRLQYRIRIGFFETKDIAKKMLQKLHDSNPGKFKGAQISKSRLSILAPETVLDTSTIQP